MSKYIKYLIDLHKEGRIDDLALGKALNALSATKDVTPVTKEQTQLTEDRTALEKLRAKRRNKKNRRKQSHRFKENYNAVINELKQLHEKETFDQKLIQELKLADKPKCGYFKAYEISIIKYKDPNKLFQDKKLVITKQIIQELQELGGLKFQLALTIEFFKDDIPIKYVTGVLHGEQMAILTTDKIDVFYNDSSAKIQTGIEKLTNKASGLEIGHCTKINLNIAKYEPLKGSSYIPLPKALANKKAIINVQNDDDRCLEWALKSALYPAKNNVCNKYSYTRHDDLNMKGVDFPTPVSQIPKVEKQNNLAINVYGYTVSKKLEKLTVFPYYISDQASDMTRINLLLISDEAEETDKTKYHYCWIKNLNRLLYNQNKHKGQTYFCDRCLYGFTREDLLIKHKEDCLGINKTPTRIQTPTEGRNHIKFKNHQNQMPVPYVIYADLESIVKPKSVKVGNKSEITNEHEPCGFSYQVVRYDGQAKEPVIYRGEDAIDVFLKRLECEKKNINNTPAHPKPLNMTEQNKEDYEAATSCWICDGTFGNPKDNPKVRDHCHFTGEYRGAAHKKCNLRLSIKPYKTKIPVVFHNLKGYDSHLIMQKIHKTRGNITCIPNNAKKSISFGIGQLKFLDSFQFMALSLEKLVDAINKSEFKITKNAFGDKK